MRKILFCISKEAVLPCKTASFTVQKNGFCNVLIDNRLCDRQVCEKYLRSYRLLSASIIQCTEVAIWKDKKGFLLEEW